MGGCVGVVVVCVCVCLCVSMRIELAGDTHNSHIYDHFRESKTM